MVPCDAAREKDEMYYSSSKGLSRKKGISATHLVTHYLTFGNLCKVLQMEWALKRNLKVGTSNDMTG